MIISIFFTNLFNITIFTKLLYFKSMVSNLLDTMDHLEKMLLCCAPHNFTPSFPIIFL